MTGRVTLGLLLGLLCLFGSAQDKGGGKFGDRSPGDGSQTRGVNLWGGEADLKQSGLGIAWLELAGGLRNDAEELLLFDLGLSSTGRIELIGCYTTTDKTKGGEGKVQQVFHIIQKDLFGGRLVWSCLLNVDARTCTILYHTNRRQETIQF